MSRVRDFLAPLSHDDMRRLWVSQVLSEAGDWAARVALAVLIFRESHSAGLSTLVTTASLLPYVAVGPWLSTFADRWPRRTILIASDLLRAALFLAMVIPQPAGVTLILVFIAGCATPPFEAARGALMPQSVPIEMYPAALSLATATYQVSIIVGTLGAGAVLATLSARFAVGLNAATFLVSALVVARLSVGRTGAAGPAPTVLAGVRALRADALVWRAVVATTAFAGCAIVTEALVPAVLAGSGGHAGGRAAVGVATIAAGNLAVTATVRLRTSAERLLRLTAIIGFVGAGLATLGFASTARFPLLLAPLAAVGVIFAASVPANAVVGTRVDNVVRASSFGVFNAILQASTAGCAALGGLAASTFGVRPTWVVANMLAVGAALIFLVIPPRPATTAGFVRRQP